MYRCQVCQGISKPGQTKGRYTVYRERKDIMQRPTGHREIAAELDVCPGCFNLLESGAPLQLLIKQRGQILKPGEVLVEKPIIGKVMAVEGPAVPKEFRPKEPREPKVQPEPVPVAVTEIAPPEPVAVLFGRSVRSEPPKKRRREMDRLVAAASATAAPKAKEETSVHPRRKGSGSR